MRNLLAKLRLRNNRKRREKYENKLFSAITWRSTREIKRLINFELYVEIKDNWSYSPPGGWFLVNLPTKIAKIKYNWRYTPLHHAALLGKLEAVKCLVEEVKVDVKAKDKRGNTPLHCAAYYGLTSLHFDAYYGKIKIANYLIKEAGAVVNIQNDLGNTPLHLAALFASTRMIKTLIKAGADVNIMNKDGETVLDIIKRKYKMYIGLMNFLRSRGAKTGEELRELRAKRKKIKDLLIKVLEEKKQEDTLEGAGRPCDKGGNRDYSR